jgi:CubicO group peptidase (beta-lactamase class C family)
MIKSTTSIFILFSTIFISIAQTTTDSLTQALEEQYQQSGFPGFAVAILTAEGIHYQKGFGFADKKKETPFTTETIMNIGSVSKTFVGVALIKAIEAGKLTMDTPINDILPFEVNNPHHPDKPILVRHLVTHTSSIPDTKYYIRSYVYEERQEDDPDLAKDYLKHLKKHKKMPLGDYLKAVLAKEGKWYRKKNYLKSAPGEEFAYSNTGAALAAYVIEVATGVPFKQYSRQEVLDPLKMTSTGWDYSEVDLSRHATLYGTDGKIIPGYSLNTYPDGGLISCVEDLSLYLQEMIKAYSGHSDYLNETSTRLLLPGDEDENRAFWGMGEKSRNIGHGGSDPGVNTMMRFNADSKIGYIVFINTNADESKKLTPYFREIWQILRGFGGRI